MGGMRPNLASRFWANVERGPGCWLWTASTVRTGRGQFRVGSKVRQAHRLAWELTYGSAPPGMLRTACGNLRCVRPDHQLVTERKVGPNNLARTVDVRFEAMVERGAGCWLWTGTVDHTGFGAFSVDVAGQGRRILRAHRVAWERAHGPIPGGAEVVHRCGTRHCVRPDHLVLRVGGRASADPTPRDLAVLRARVRHGLGYGSLLQAAVELGIGSVNAAHHLARLRARLGVASNAEAVRWLDANRRGWRRELVSPERAVSRDPPVPD